MSDKKTQPLGTALKRDFLFLIVISLIVLVCYFKNFNSMVNYVRIGYIAFLIIGFILANKGSKIAGIIGIIVGILMMSTIIDHDYLDALLGLILTIHSVKFIRNYNRQAQETNTQY